MGADTGSWCRIAIHGNVSAMSWFSLPPQPDKNIGLENSPPSFSPLQKRAFRIEKNQNTDQIGLGNRSTWINSS
jgi:hypothetical protein